MKPFLLANGMYYYQHNIGDFDKKTRHLTRLERSIYLDMIHLYYVTEQQLSGDIAAVCRKILARTEEEKAAVLAVLDEFFVSTPDGWYHERCEEEIEAYRKNNSQKSLAGKASAAARAQKLQEAINGSSTDVDTSVQRSFNGASTNHKPITNNHKPLTKEVKPTAPPNGETGEVFDYWKTVMVHPNAKLDAKRAKAISARLKDGYTVGDLCKAVDGCKYDPWSQGANDRQSVFDDIELICRDGGKVDKFIAIADKGQYGQSSLSEFGQATANAAREWMEGQNAR